MGSIKSSRKGSCACGNLQYEVTSDPLKIVSLLFPRACYHLPKLSFGDLSDCLPCARMRLTRSTYRLFVIAFSVAT
jgi:hypothetical protein